jgi:magnesium chelatase subunit I
LENLIQKYQPEIPVSDKYFLKEFILWALVEYNKLSKERTEDGFQFKDPYSKFISKLS